MNHFAVTPCKTIGWNFNETKEIPLENTFSVKDPRKPSLKRWLEEKEIDITTKRMWKSQEEWDFATTSATALDLPTDINTSNSENTLIQGVVPHVRDSEINLLPEPEPTEDMKEVFNGAGIRKVYLNITFGNYFGPMQV